MSCPPQRSVPACGTCSTSNNLEKGSLKACLAVNPNHEDIINSAVQSGKLNKLQASNMTSKDIHKLQAAFLKGKLWPQNSTIRVSFFRDRNYTDAKRDWVIKVITNNIVYLDGNKDKPLVNLKFVWDYSPSDPTQGDVRITFDPDGGAYSYIGIDARGIPGNQPTMNLGWIDDHTNFDFDAAKGTGVVVIHEFGHMLGMIHEHTRADFGVKWNCNQLVSDLSKGNNNWDWCTIYNNVLKTYETSEFNGSKYDPLSVMHYWFPNRFFCGNPNLPHVTKLSYNDKVWLQKSYPPKNLVTIPGASDDSSSDTKVMNWTNIILMILVIAGLAILFIKLSGKWSKGGKGGKGIGLGKTFSNMFKKGRKRRS
jgi:hypothetical protein